MTVPSPKAFLQSIHPGGDPAVLLSFDEHFEEGEAAATADIIDLNLTDAQCANSATRHGALRWALSALAPDGIIWFSVPGRWRSWFSRGLRSEGLRIRAMSVARHRGAARMDMSLSVRAIRFAMGRGFISSRWRWLPALLNSLPLGKAAVFRFMPELGFAACRPGTSPFGWLVRRLPDPGNSDFIVSTSWRGERSPFMVFGIGDEKALVAKRALRGEASIAHEADALTQVGIGAVGEGIKVPELVGRDDSKRLSTLIETAVPGRPMKSLIRDGHHQDLPALANRLADWIGQWNSKTVEHVELTASLAEGFILTPARIIFGTGNEVAYQRWLSSEVSELIGQKVPLVATHNDLTMANILGDRSGIRSVVDWEAATDKGLPLTDLHYAVCDAAAAIGGGDRMAAFRRCFLDDSEIRRHLAGLDNRLRQIVGGPPEWLNLCIHAGWLAHAANERARAPETRGGDFTNIVNLLAFGVTGKSNATEA